MSKFPQARKGKPPFTPAWMRTARAWYGPAFEAGKKSELAEAMADWTEMTEEERSFVLAHLNYLGLLAQLGTQKLLRELRALFEEVGDEVIEAIEASMEAEATEVLEDEVGAEAEPEGRRLEAVEDTPIPVDEPEPRWMPVEAVAPEMLRAAEEEPVRLVIDDGDDEPDLPEGA